MLRTHQGRADRAPTPGNDVAAQQNEQVVYVPNENYRNPSRGTKHQQELLKDYFIMWGHWLGRTGSEILQPTTLGAEAGIYQSFSGLLSGLFRTNQLFQELLFKLVLLKLPTNVLSKSISLPTMMENTSKPISSPLFKTLNPSYVQIKPPPSQTLCGAELIFYPAGMMTACFSSV